MKNTGAKKQMGECDCDGLCHPGHGHEVYCSSLKNTKTTKNDSTIAEILEEFNKFIMGRHKLIKVTGIAPYVEPIKDFIVKALTRQRTALIEQIEREVEQVRKEMKDAHACIFNDGKQDCECYLGAIYELNAKLTALRKEV